MQKQFFKILESIQRFLRQRGFAAARLKAACLRRSVVVIICHAPGTNCGTFCLSRSRVMTIVTQVMHRSIFRYVSNYL